MSIAQIIAETLHNISEETDSGYLPLIIFGIVLFIGIFGPILLGVILSN